MTLSLILDTTGHTLMVGLYQDQSLVFKHHAQSDSHRYHSAILPPLIQNALAEQNANANDLEKIIVNIGPGSFTGIRTGVSMARTMAQFTTAKTYGINTFDIWLTGLHQIHPEINQLLLLMDAFRSRAYSVSGNFKGDSLNITHKASITPLADIEALSKTTQADAIFIASSLSNKLEIKHHQLTLLEETNLFTPDVMMHLVQNNPEQYLTPWQTLMPLYLQEPHITQKKAKQPAC